MAAKKTTKRKSAARKSTTPRVKPPEPVTFKLDPTPSGYSIQNFKDGASGMWCKMDPTPGFVADREREHVYIYANGSTYTVDGKIGSERVVGQWGAAPQNASTDKEAKRIGLGVTNATVDRENLTLTLTIPADRFPSRFDDTPENRQRNKAHVTALRKLIDVMTGFGDRARAIDAINSMVSTKNVTIGVNLSEEEIDKAVAEAKAAFDDARLIEEAVSGLSDHDKTVVLRHMAHLFEIRKGATRLR